VVPRAAGAQGQLAARGVRFVFAVAPDKESIYPERLPPTWSPLGPTTLDRLLAELRRRTDVEIVDLRPALLAEKANDRPEVEDLAYFPRGTHWTPRGAFAASQEILRRIARDFPRAGELPRTAFRTVAGAPEQEDSWAQILYAPGCCARATRSSR
jgi:hypothetical protein